MHSVKTVVIACCAVSSFASTPAFSQNIKMKDMIAGDREKVAALAKEANQACGTQIAFAVDYPSYSRLFDDDNNQRPWAYLANVTDAFKSVCRTDAGQQAIREKIRSVSVANASAESESLAGGAFRYAVPYSGHSPATIVKWLQSNL